MPVLSCAEGHGGELVVEIVSLKLIKLNIVVCGVVTELIVPLPS